VTRITVKLNRWPNLATRIVALNPPTEMETAMRLDEKQNLFALELSDEDIEIVSGGENCTYSSQTYSPV